MVTGVTLSVPLLGGVLERLCQLRVTLGVGVAGAPSAIPPVHPHRPPPLQLPCVRALLQPASQHAAPPADPQGGALVQVRLLRQDLHPAPDPQGSHGGARRPQALQVHSLW